MLGEHDTRTDPDCPKQSGHSPCGPKKITRKIAEVIKHENFGGRPSAPDNDIALIRLNEPVPLYSEDAFKSAVTPVCLPWSPNNEVRNIDEGKRVLVTGWGASTNVKRDVQDNLIKLGVSFPTLLQVGVPIANSKCSEDNVFSINEKLQICAGGEKGN